MALGFNDGANKRAESQEVAPRPAPAEMRVPQPLSPSLGRPDETGKLLNQLTKPADNNISKFGFPSSERFQITAPTAQVLASDRVTELHRMRHRSGPHDSADALVHIPKGFDPTKPVNVVIFNHGWGSTVSSAYRRGGLGAAMANAPPNTVLILPEWQSRPGADSGAQGRFAEPGMFRGMLQEIFDRTPGLTGRKVDDIAGISIVAHSAGYNPTETILYKNGLGHKVKSITMLDATYNPRGLDRWLQENIRDLANGTKQFHNIYNGTGGDSRAQVNRIKGWLQQLRLPNAVLEDHSDPKSIMTASRLATSPIVFKFTTAAPRGMDAHANLPNLYFGTVLSSLRRR